MLGTVSEKLGSNGQYLVRKFYKNAVRAHVVNQTLNQMCSYVPDLNIFVSAINADLKLLQTVAFATYTLDKSRPVQD